jgi:transposase-like protein
MKESTEVLLDELLKDYQTPEQILGENGILKQLTKRLAERALQAEMTHHLGYAKHDYQGKAQKDTLDDFINHHTDDNLLDDEQPSAKEENIQSADDKATTVAGKPARKNSNARNGTTKKTVRTDFGKIELDVPRDRTGSFEPQFVKKHERTLNGFDDKVISLYSRGMSTRDIQAHLKEIYGVDVSSTFISTVTDSVLDEVKQWQQRPLEPIYPVVYLDGLVVKNREEGIAHNKCVYLALGINTEGRKELLGLWIEKNEGAKFWLKVMNELKSRGVQDIFIACCDGLKGFPEAIETVFPKTKVQLCIVHQVRNSLKYVSHKQRKEIAIDLKTIYGADTLAEAEDNLLAFAEKWDGEHPQISKAWQENWGRLTTFFDYPKDIRRVIYTTNTIESLNASLRKVTSTKKTFPNDDAVFKAIYMALINTMQKWTMPIQNWKPAMRQFVMLYGHRVEGY